MGSKSDYLENKVLDHVLRGNTGGTSYTQPTTLYVGLYTVTPSDTGGGTEVSGGSYARQTITFTAASGGSSSNSNLITFPSATANWGTVVAFGLFDASTSGNLLYWNALTTNKSIVTGDTATFTIGSLVISED